MTGIRSVRGVAGLIAAVVVGVGPARAAIAAAPSPVTFGIEPAAGSNDTRSALSYGLVPGSSATDRVAVVNYSKRALPVRVYGVDATGSGATFALAASTSTQTGVGAWLWFGSKHFVELTVPARTVHGNGIQTPGRTVVPVRIDIGAQARAGEHAGGVVVSLESRTKGSAGGVTLEQRVALRVYVTIAGAYVSHAPGTSASNRVASTSHSLAAAPIWAAVLAAFALLVGAVFWRRGRPAPSRRK